MIETTLKVMVTMIGAIYIMVISLTKMELKWFIVLSLVAFAMVITVLLLGKYTFGVW